MNRRSWYVGLKYGGKHIAFSLPFMPVPFCVPFVAVIGPFRTKRAAKWAEKYGENNPHFQHVRDAERISKGTV